MALGTMRSKPALRLAAVASEQSYVLEEQVGFLLRRAHQRHVAIFLDCMGELGLTPRQFSALVKIRDEAEVSQNKLGRLIAMDSATILGVVQRLLKRGLIKKRASLEDSRSTILSLSPRGEALLREAIPLAKIATQKTLESLDAPSRRVLCRMLDRLDE
jgi:DNA-binding MarR family transcriptional regulator